MESRVIDTAAIMEISSHDSLTALAANADAKKAKQEHNGENDLASVSANDLDQGRQGSHQEDVQALIMRTGGTQRPSLIVKLPVVQPFPFMRLALEIRVMVYKELLIQVSS